METVGTILPVYFVADESGSMVFDIDELNSGLETLLSSLRSEPFAAAKVRFAVLGFSDSAMAYMPPSDLREVESMPQFSPKGLTSYKAAFDLLSACISFDIPNFKAAGYLVNRPAVFFLTDGVPTDAEDEWKSSRAELLSIAARPNILAFGIGDADPQTILEVATSPEYALVAAAGTNTGLAVTEFIKSLTQSVISSGQGMASGTSALQLERPESFSFAVDLV